MIQTVQERKKNIHNFMEYYPNLCRLQNIVPNPSIKVNSSNNFLDFVGDRLKVDEWKPLLEAISNDRSLHFISIRSKYNNIKAAQENKDESGDRPSSTPKSYASFTNDTVLKLTESLSKCLSSSAALTGLVLEKLPLVAESLNHLTQGLEVCRNLQQLSLPHCQIGDDGCAALCQVLRRRLNLVWLNLSGCCLTERGVGLLCDLLKFQKLNRYGESWKQSLRYRPVNPNTMPGLRRLTLNHNPFGDAGVKIFIDTLIDDLWLKALDLQNCGISLLGAEQLLNLVKENQFLSVVDIRGNNQVPKSLVAAVVQQLAENNTDTTPEFQWLKEDNARTTAGSSTVSLSRSSQRLNSNTTLCSKNRSLLTILPNKSRASPAVPPTRCSRPRSSSAKRAQTTNNTPRPPWNSNNQSNLRRGNSDQHIIQNNKKNNEGIVFELNYVKEQLEDVSRKLDEETEKRIKIEQQLENYKKIIPIPENLTTSDLATIRKALDQLHNNELRSVVESVLPHRDRDRREEENDKNNTETLDFLIKAVNGENGFNLHNSNQRKDVEQKPPKQKESPSRAQMLFETLISS